MNYKNSMDDKLNIYLPKLMSIVQKAIQNISSKSKKSFSDEINLFFHEIKQAEDCKKIIRIFNTQNKDDYIDLKGIEEFKIWLIDKQSDERYAYLLSALKLYCKKNGIPLSKLNIVFGDSVNGSIYNTDMYFNNKYENVWFENPEMQKMIKSVDKSEVINANSINSPIFGVMPPTKLSGGAKTLMLIYNNPNMIFNASTCGDNCAKWITKFSKEKDFIINLRHVMKFSNKDFQAYIVNDGTTIYSLKELYFAENKYCRK